MLFILLLKVYTLLTPSSCFPNPAVSGGYSFYEFDFLFFQISHISDPMLYLSFSVWLIALNIMPLRFIYVVISGRIPFFIMAEWYSFVLYHIPFVHSSINEYLGCFHIMIIVDKGISEHRGADLQDLVFVSFGSLPGSRTVGSYSSF